MTVVNLQLGTVAHLELNDPPLNLVTGELLRELDDALAVLETTEPGHVRAVVVSGAGEKAFSVGSNVKEFEGHRGPDGRARFELEARVAQRLAGLPMPTIAAIEGSALGGGLELALCCDLRVASERAQLGLPEVRLAVTPSTGGTQRLPRIVGVGRAKELLLTGRILTAQEAERIGLVSEVVPAGEAVGTCASHRRGDRGARPAGCPRGQDADRRRARPRPCRRPLRGSRDLRPHLRHGRPARGRTRLHRQA